MFSFSSRHVMSVSNEDTQKRRHLYLASLLLNKLEFKGHFCRLKQLWLGNISPQRVLRVVSKYKEVFFLQKNPYK